MSLTFLKKGCFFLPKYSLFEKRVSIFSIFNILNFSIGPSLLKEMQPFCRIWVPSVVSVQKKKGGFFPMAKSVERGTLVFWRMIIRPPFTFEWQERDLISSPGF